MENEIWKSVKGFEGLYEVSNFGMVRSLPRNTTCGKILVYVMTKNGYARVNLWKEGKSKALLVHRIVAQAFIPNPNDLPQVNHIDENKLNNAVDNLEWCTNLENHRHGTINQRVSAAQRNDFAKSKPVGQYAKSGEFICVFPSIREAERSTGIHSQSISQCCRSKIKAAGGFVWKYTTA